MHSKYTDIIDKCTGCDLRSNKFFCQLPPKTLRDFDEITVGNLYPKGALLFGEGQSPRGVYILCQGRLKLSMTSRVGRSLILGIMEAGEVLGLNAVISNTPYGVTAEVLEPCQAKFVRKEDFLKFIEYDDQVRLNVLEHISRHYSCAYTQLRFLGLSQSVAEKLARLLLEWTSTAGNESVIGKRFTRPLTHEEIARMICTTRESVSRAFGDLVGRRIIKVSGSTLTIRDRVALQALAGTLVT